MYLEVKIASWRPCRQLFKGCGYSLVLSHKAFAVILHIYAVLAEVVLCQPCKMAPKLASIFKAAFLLYCLGAGLVIYVLCDGMHRALFALNCFDKFQIEAFKCSSEYLVPSSPFRTLKLVVSVA